MKAPSPPLPWAVLPRDREVYQGEVKVVTRSLLALAAPCSSLFHRHHLLQLLVRRPRWGCRGSSSSAVLAAVPAPLQRRHGARPPQTRSGLGAVNHSGTFLGS